EELTHEETGSFIRAHLLGRRKCEPGGGRRGRTGRIHRIVRRPGLGFVDKLAARRRVLPARAIQSSYCRRCEWRYRQQACRTGRYTGGLRMEPCELRAVKMGPEARR